MLSLPRDERLAIVDQNGAATYRDLDDAANRIATGLLGGRTDLDEARVALMAAPGLGYAAALLGIWRAGGVAVPLPLSHPPAELDHVIRDAAVESVLADTSYVEVVSRVPGAASRARMAIGALLGGAPTDDRPDLSGNRRALMVYTSGTTGRPKGVVTTHGALAAQVSALVSAWGWTAQDRILHVLPLHHVHGIVNGLLSALAAGAVCELAPAFDARHVWTRFASGEITVFTAVPTIYKRLIAAWDEAADDEREIWTDGARRLRLMMSGSAALPIATLERWRALTGHTLLERYGMTELGMALSNPLTGERRPGFVGTPLPGVEVRLVDDAGAAVAAGTPGDIEVRGPNVFLEYWQRPEDTKAAFRDGWFRTGDAAVLDDGAYRILGRNSTDIIKTGGFKVSALEIEDVLRTHPAIADCAVVGVDDPEWGERVSVAVEGRGSAALSIEELRQWARPLLAPYKIPRALQIVDALPRNAMGKVVKPDVAALFRAG